MKLPILKGSEVETRFPLNRMTLEEYLEFVWYFLKNADPDRLEAQRRGEEKIEKRFCLGGQQSARSARADPRPLTAAHPQADLLRWVDCWQRVGPELERMRAEEIRNADTQAAVCAFGGMLPGVLERFPPPPTSGLTEQQRLFSRLRRE